MLKRILASICLAAFIVIVSGCSKSESGTPASGTATETPAGENTDAKPADEPK